ncbi:peptidylprolyl isomerase [Candidatus Thioglobus sp.]|jgi:FKBP-type peptidyl-prolyl cis-trans isomerase SlyD|uniref:FKBP-type peptidyl-prolyl cis-trans isomerase n=1 Tax=Candidatus Thioglobus sp. TaxID=2026721 RepID=UPI001E0D361B|nr:peptidylprolyl isomerase [Candidatus Thioglobus sp.]MBT3277656.1 peptidylprolyl isomerase [Candidatus Thioglobus sp.]MBT3447221.1 peptidylprolyl isomerase [Candidatus Thioglobus sp.]MBT4000670.1 peptidylprolyl isomerase [Candidatus Thioglobus sp.]MBT4182149.1 peptidylprolyl isomerase [Candidatus Thioglobus sp.]MBT4422216.1 peptidylprolyl isomerase [Candidatus Thioglobus sp.]
MTVQKDAVVEMHYTLKNDAGEVIDSSQGKEPMPFIQGHGNIIPGLEKALEGMKVGETCDVSVAPEDAYGVHHAEGIQEIPMEALQGIENLEVGMELQSQDEQGNPFIVRVEEIKEEVVVINANHPLAGETLHFNVSIEKVREATADELEHGHVHSGTCSH